MGAYGGQTSVEERWAIIAFVRALQRSQLAMIDDVPAEHKDALTDPLSPGAAAKE